MTDKILVLSTSDSAEQAREIAGRIDRAEFVDGWDALLACEDVPLILMLTNNRDAGRLTLEAIEAGKIMFAIDQQQYLQGYLPVVFLYLYNANLNTVGGGLPVLTGPGIVDASNAAAVKDLAAAGTR